MAAKRDDKSRFDFIEKRPLFREDLNEDEKNRMDKRRQEVAASAPAVAAKEVKDKKLAGELAKVKPKRESRKAVTGRIADTLMNPDPELRLPGEPVVPNADWYPRIHGGPLRKIAEDTGLPHERVATASGVMSPQNNPADERVATRAFAEAESRNSTLRVSQQLANYMPKSSRIREQGAGEYGFAELEPDEIRRVATAKNRDSGHVTSEADLKGMAKAGTNKVSGVRGLRGASVSELAPPGSAPKVHTYTQHGYAFGTLHESSDRPGGGSKFDPNDNFIAEEVRFRAAHAATQIPGQTNLDVHGLNDDTIHMTKELYDHLTSKGATVRGNLIGRPVRVRDLHPSAVFALSHPDVSAVHADGDRIQKLAKLSSNLPTVMDSWANGVVHGYGTISATLSKPTGSNKAGYWMGKSLADGSDILDTRDGRVSAAALQHADYDSLHRDAAKEITSRMSVYTEPPKKATLGKGATSEERRARKAEVAEATKKASAARKDAAPTSMDYPSTAVQAGSWVLERRGAGKDADFNRAKKSMTVTTSSPASVTMSTGEGKVVKASQPSLFSKDLSGPAKTAEPSRKPSKADATNTAAMRALNAKSPKAPKKSG